MRVIALDYGTKVIGVAISDELQLTARPLATLRRGKLKFAQLLAQINALVNEYAVGALVVGLPYNLDGTRGPATSRVESFIAELRKVVAVPLLTIDERLTSHEAEQLLREAGADERERRAKADEYAAMIILQDYLDSQRHAQKEKENRPGSHEPS
jgi:putative Holliday junction resolvase